MTVPLFLGVVAIEQISAIPNQLASLIALFGVLFAGNQMFQDAIGSIQNRVMGFQILTSLAVLGALFLQEWAEALMVVGLVGFSSHLEERALIRARESMQGGLDRLPRRARLANPVHSEERKDRTINVLQITSNPSLSVSDCLNEDLIPVEALELGDLVEVRSGEVMPVDGVVTEGTGSIDRAPLTGEPIPIPVNQGDNVEAGLVLAVSYTHLTLPTRCSV